MCEQILLQLQQQLQGQRLYLSWTPAELRFSIWSQMQDQVRIDVWFQIGHLIRVRIEHLTWDQTGSPVWNQIGSRARVQIWDQVGTDA